MTLLWIAALPWIAALVVAQVPPARRGAAASIAGVTALAALGLLVAQSPAMFDGEVVRFSVDWLPALGMSYGLRLDGLAWLFGLLITGIGALVVLYAAWYIADEDPAPRFFSFLLMFMGAMLGVVLADNLVLLVLYWELTSLTSFLLIGYWHDREDAREGARMALTITAAGGLCLLAGVLLIGHIVGSTQLDDVLAAGDVLRAHPMYLTALVLVLLGAFTKSAQFPFHFWLPHAMAAPTPVSAYLHSATMVKAGVFLLARLYPALGGSEPWFWIVSSVGLATMLFGAWAAIYQHDLKGLLAYSTISHLGLITLLFGLDEPLAIVAGVFHILNHATFKASLFMSAGIIDHECGTRDMRRINGLIGPMPFTATLGITAAAAMAGVPLLNGFLSKEMFFAETVAIEGRGAMEWLLPAGATLAGVFSVAYSARFVHDVFFNGKPHDLPHEPHEPPLFMRLPVALLVALCLAVGLVPAVVAGPLLAVAAQAALFGTPLPAYTLAIWHGINPALVMSVVAVAGGIALYAGLRRFMDLHGVVRMPGWITAGGREFFQALQAGGLALSAMLTATLETGSLQRYLALLVAAALAAGAWPFIDAWVPAAVPLPAIDPLPFGVAVVGLIGIASTLAVVVTRRQRLVAVVAMGGAGLVVCLTFVWFSAPDLALTQLLVEMATTVLLMLSLRWLPPVSEPATIRWRAAVHALLAIASGIGMAALAWIVMTRPSLSIADFFIANALPLGGGANVVNVIIVDFRGFDTLGEIVVLAIAAIVMHALLSGIEPMPGASRADPEGERHPLLLKLVSQQVLPFAILVSIYLFVRGHNQPGGGFIAGLVLAISLLLIQVARGQDWAVPRFGSDFRRWIGGGLAIAVVTGVGAFAFGSPFLTSTYDYPWLPGVGGVPLASAAAFDLGVYLVVVGGTMVMLLSIARLSRGTGTR